MHIRDNSKAQGWFRKHAAAPSSVGSWKAFVARNKTVQEPLNMADGGRIGFRRAGKATTDSKIRTDLEEIIIKKGKVEGQENIKWRDIKNRKTGKVKRVYDVQIIKDTQLGKGAQKGPRKNYTGRYDIVLNERGLTSLDEATKIRDTFRTKNPKDLPPPADPTKKYKLKKEKKVAIKKKGGYYSGPHTGTPQTHLGHTGNVWGTEKITGDKLAYTPKDINEAMAAEKVGLDHKIRKVSEKIEKIKKQKIPAAMKKKMLEVEDALLVRIASQSQGFKKVTLSDGSTFGGDRLTIDPFDEFAGKTEREINEFVKKWKNKKTWNTAEEFNNIKKAKLFEANRKSSLKAASKIGKKEQKKIISEFNKKFIKLGCGMYAGGRVGFAVGSGKCINRAIAKLKSGNLTTVEKKLMSGLGDDLTKIAGKGGMPKGFWTTTLKGEGYFALADFANNLTKGQGLDKSFSNAVEMATFGALDLGGNERDLMRYAKERGLDTKDMKEWMDYAETYGKYVEGHKDLAEREKIVEASGGEEEYWKNFQPNTILNPSADVSDPSLWDAENKIERAEKQLEEQGKSESIQSGKGYKDMNEMIEGVIAKEWNKTAGTPFDRGIRKMLGIKGDEGMVWGPVGTLFREGMEQAGFGEHEALKGFTPQKVMNYHPVYGYKEDIKDVIREGDSPMEDMLDFMGKYYPRSALLDEAARDKMGIYDYDPELYAGGGIAGVRRPKALPPKSGPTPYGLPSMLNRVKKV